MFREKFDRQSVPKSEHPSEEELERTRKAFEEADPTRSSHLNLSGEISIQWAEAKGRGAPFAEHATGTYVELDSTKHPREQQAIARLVKGIIPIADIVSYDQEHVARFSKVMPLERIEATTSEAQLRAYIDFMYLVFGDEDRREHGDLQHNYEHVGGKAILYDFGNFDLTTIPLTTAPQNRRYQTLESLTELVDELNAFHARIEGEQGRDFLKAVLTSSDIAPRDLYQVSYGETTIEDLHEQLLARTNRALLIAQNERRALEAAEA